MSTPEDAIAPTEAPDGAAEAPALESARPSGSVKSAAIWTLLGFGGAQVVRFVSRIVLADLVLPDVLGLIALVYAFMTGLHMFTDVGIATSLIQNKRGDNPDFYNTAWTLQILRGAVLGLGMLLIAWPVSYAFGEPMLMFLLPAVGLNALIESFSSTSLPALKRHFRLDRFVILDLSTTVIGSATTIAYAKWIDPSPWAMIFGPMLNFFLMMAISHVILPGYRNHFRWDRTALDDLLHFGKWIFIGTICTFLAFQADSIIVGGFMKIGRTPSEAMAQLGIYANASSFVGIATLLMGALATQLVFPLYSRWHQAGRNVQQEFGRIHIAAAGIAALLATGMLATGPAAIDAMFKPDYHAGGRIMQFLAVGAWFSMLEGNVGALLLALGQPRSVMLSNATKLAGLVIFVPLGYWLGYLHSGVEGGFMGLLFGFIISDFARYLVVQVLAHANGVAGWPYDLALTVLIVAIAPLGFLVGEQVIHALLGDSPAAACERFLLSVLGQEFFAERSLPGWSNRFGHLVLFGCQGLIVTAIWGGIGLAWWRLSKRRFRPQEAA